MAGVRHTHAALPSGAEELCVERQTADGRSTLALVRGLARLRAGTVALQSGAQRTIDAGPTVLAWLREASGDRILGAMNFAATPAPADLRDGSLNERAELVLSTDPCRDGGDVDLATLTLGPSEALLVRT